MNSPTSLRSSDLRGSSYLQAADNDPMSSMGNLMDVMLVFACALLIALVTHYNVQLSPDSATDDSLQPIEGQMETAQGENTQLEDMTAVGTLYYDDETDEYYVLTE